jgi:hypothetical protein
MVADSSWAAAALIRSVDTTLVMPLPLDRYGKGVLTVPQWKSAEELIITVTSGFSDKARSYDVEFVPCPVTYAAGTIDTLFPDSTHQGFPIITLTAHTDLRCELLFNRFSSSALLESASNQGLASIDSLYEIAFPTSWRDSAALQLVTLDTTNDTLLFCRWSGDLKTWTLLDTILTDGNIPVTINIRHPGIHGFFIPEQPGNLKSDIFVFPNPAHIGNGTGIVRYEGSNISEALVYSIDGTLVYSARHQASQTNKRERFIWTLKHSNGTIVTPGLYTILIKYILNNKFNFHRQKIVLVP